MKSNTATALAFLCILAATLFDFRPYNIRVLDFIPLIVVGIFVLWALYNKKEYHIDKLNLAVWAVVVLYSLYGYVVYQHVSSLFIIALATAAFSFKAFHQAPIKSEVFITVLSVLIAWFFLQVVVYHVTGYVIDLQELFGKSSRNFQDWALRIFRPSAAFQEPNNYVLVICYLMLMTLGEARYNKIHYLGALTMLLSYSLWGQIAAFAFLALSIIWTSRTFREMLKRYCLIAVSLVIFLSVYDYYLIPNANGIMYQVDRIIGIQKDASAGERFSSHKPFERTIPSELVDQVEDRSKENFMQRAIGQGLSTFPFYQGIALNSYSFAFHAFGWLSIGFFLFLIGVYWKRSPELQTVEKLSYLGGVFFISLNYPIVTYALFWIWVLHIPTKNLYHSLDQAYVSQKLDKK